MRQKPPTYEFLRGIRCKHALGRENGLDSKNSDIAINPLSSIYGSIDDLRRSPRWLNGRLILIFAYAFSAAHRSTHSSLSESGEFGLAAEPLSNQSTCARSVIFLWLRFCERFELWSSTLVRKALCFARASIVLLWSTVSTYGRLSRLAWR